MTQPDLVCMGEPLVELNQTRPGEPGYLLGFGGDTSNCAIAAARQGAKVGYLTALGQDGFGDAFVELWEREGVDYAHVLRLAGAHTGVYFVSHGASGHEFTYLRAGSAASRLGPRDVPRDYIAKARVLHVSGISQAISAEACDAVLAAIEIAKAAGVSVSFDTNLRLRLWPLPRARAIIAATAAMADILLPGLDDVRQLLGLEDPDAIADHYLGQGVPLVVLTLGAAGALVATPERRQRLAPHRVEAVDATGAGDTFDGAFLAEHLRTGDPFAAARWANAAAAIATTGFGAVAPMPKRPAVDAFLREREGG
jgi:2-dehydro-3-deoxygluconokinase